MKLKALIALFFTLTFCFAAQAQVTRCVDPNTGRATFTDGSCSPSQNRSENSVNSNFNVVTLEGERMPARTTRNAPRRNTANRGGGVSNTSKICLRRCPYNGACLQYK